MAKHSDTIDEVKPEVKPEAAEVPVSTALAYDDLPELRGNRVDYGKKDPADMTNEEWAWWAYENLMPHWAIRASLLTRAPIVLSSIEPTTAAIGDPSFRLFVSGTGFVKDTSVIVFAGRDENTGMEEDGRLTTGVNMDYWHGPDVIKVQVRNGPNISEPLDFTFTAEVPEGDDPGGDDDCDPDDLEEEIEEAKSYGDVRSGGRPKAKKKK